MNDWEKIAKAFRLPGHFVKVADRKQTSVISIRRTHRFTHFREKLWMHTVASDPLDPWAFTMNASQPLQEGEKSWPFAVAATHFESREFTIAVMVGCSQIQIETVRRLVKGWQDASGHPLLMLGLCAELELDRLDHLIHRQGKAYDQLKTELTSNAASKSPDRFSWELIDKVRAISEESNKIEEEVKTTKLQLFKACSFGITAVIKQHEHGETVCGTNAPRLGRSDCDNGPGDGTVGIGYNATEETAVPFVHTATTGNDGDVLAAPTTDDYEIFVETTAMFSERFNDILSRFDGLCSNCRIYVENISFATDIVSLFLERTSFGQIDQVLGLLTVSLKIRSQLARQEANTTAKISQLGTAISFVALIYLPMTAVAVSRRTKAPDWLTGN